MSDVNGKYDWDAIEAFVAEAEKDNRIGEHEAVVIDVTRENPEFDPSLTLYRTKVALLTANNATLEFSLAPPMTKAEIQATPENRKRGAAFGQKLMVHLKRHYGFEHPSQLKAGDKLRLSIKPRKSKKDPSKSYPAVDDILPKAAGEPAVSDGPSF